MPKLIKKEADLDWIPVTHMQINPTNSSIHKEARGIFSDTDLKRKKEKKKAKHFLIAVEFLWFASSYVFRCLVCFFVCLFQKNTWSRNTTTTSDTIVRFILLDESSSALELQATPQFRQRKSRLKRNLSPCINNNVVLSLAALENSLGTPPGLGGWVTCHTPALSSHSSLHPLVFSSFELQVSNPPSAVK